MLDPSIVPAKLILPTWTDAHPHIPPSHVSVSPPDSSSVTPGTPPPHYPCTRAPALPFLRRPSGSDRFKGYLPLLATVNLPWTPASDGIQSMPGWPPPTLPGRAPWRLGTRSYDCASSSTWKLVGGGAGGVQVEDGTIPTILEPKVPDDLVLQSSTPHALYRR